MQRVNVCVRWPLSRVNRVLCKHHNLMFIHKLVTSRTIARNTTLRLYERFHFQASSRQCFSSPLKVIITWNIIFLPLLLPPFKLKARVSWILHSSSWQLISFVITAFMLDYQLRWYDSEKSRSFSEERAGLNTTIEVKRGSGGARYGMLFLNTWTDATSSPLPPTALPWQPVKTKHSLS